MLSVPHCAATRFAVDCKHAVVDAVVAAGAAASACRSKTGSAVANEQAAGLTVAASEAAGLSVAAGMNAAAVEASEVVAWTPTSSFVSGTVAAVGNLTGSLSVRFSTT